jgi:hypothetical protein
LVFSATNIKIYGIDFPIIWCKIRVVGMEKYKRKLEVNMVMKLTKITVIMVVFLAALPSCGT